MPSRAARRRRFRKAKAKEMTLPEAANDEVPPPPERFGHGDAIERARASDAMPWGDRPPLRVATENMLDRYLRQGAIKQPQHDAGMRLYREWLGTGANPKVVGGFLIRIEAPPSFSAHQAEMRLLVNRAAAAVGPVAYGVLFHVCCCNLSARDWTLARGYRVNVAKSAGIVILKEALHSLEKHYRERGGR